MVGADSILADGSLINGIPTKKVALGAKSAKIPMYVICGTAKFNVLSYLGRKVEIEKGFIHIPAKFITAILTENGEIKPCDVRNHMEQMQKYVAFMEEMKNLFKP
jgi:translation initiation factor 2B subunit (eIF-2B alpha/beta/delta family)